MDINVEGRPIQQVSNFTYLGAVISGDGTIDKELTSRIQKASGAFYQLSSIWNSCNIRTLMKVRIYKAAIPTIVLLNGSVVWNTTHTQMRRFEAFHLRCLRRILRIKWNYFVSNAKVLRSANIAPVDGFIRLVLDLDGSVMWSGCQKKEYPTIFCTGPLSMAEGKEAGLARTGCPVSVTMQLSNITMVAAVLQATDRVQWRGLIRPNKELL